VGEAGQVGRRGAEGGALDDEDGWLSVDTSEKGDAAAGLVWAEAS